MKHMIIIFTLFLTLLVGCKKKETSFEKVDFAHLMGKGEKCWDYIQTAEDEERLAFFRSIYEKDQTLVSPDLLQQKIPKTFHFIWIGPKDFPKGSLNNLASWIEKHPEWVFKFWTDRSRPLPHPKIKLERISNDFLDTLNFCYQNSDNYAEKSDILRYEILKKEGGVYIDHDVICFNNLDSLIENHHFFCGLEPPHQPIGSSSISICNNIIASVPDHPILESTIQKVKDRWERIGKMYPGTDKDSTIYRVFYRTFSSFEEAVFEHVKNHFLYKSVVLPARYFNSLGQQKGLFANHTYDGTWYQNSDPFEKLLVERLFKMSRKMNKIILVHAISTTVSLFAVIVMFFLYRREKKRAKRV